MKKRTAALVLAGFVLLSGCGGIEDVEESTVTVDKKNGAVTAALVEEFSSEQYDAGELETSVKELVESYNKEAGEDRVVLKKVEVEEETAKVMLEFSDDQDYRGFNQVDFFAGTVKQAKEEGYAFAGEFTDSKGKDAASGVIPENCLENQVIIIREPLQVLVPGKILYVSKNMEITGSDTARLQADSEFPYENAQVTTEAYGYVIYGAK